MTASPREKKDTVSTDAIGPTRAVSGATKVAKTVSPSKVSVQWLATPETHDYPAAASYLSLVADRSKTRTLVSALKIAPITYYKAKDLLRACGLPLLPADNPHVAKDLTHIRAGKPLSPCLLIRGDLGKRRPAQIADGYHRVCASYYVDENTEIPVKIVKF